MIEAVDEMIDELEGKTALSANECEMLGLLAEVKAEIGGHVLNRSDIIRMLAQVGRKMTVHVAMKRHGYRTERIANMAINRALAVTPEQVDGAAEKIIAGGVLC